MSEPNELVDSVKRAVKDQLTRKPRPASGRQFLAFITFHAMITRELLTYAWVLTSIVVVVFIFQSPFIRRMGEYDDATAAVLALFAIVAVRIFFELLALPFVIHEQLTNIERLLTTEPSETEPPCAAENV